MFRLQPTFSIVIAVMLLMHPIAQTTAQNTTSTPLPDARAPLGLSSVHVGRLTADEIAALFTNLPTSFGDHTQSETQPVFHVEAGNEMISSSGLNPPVFRVEDPTTIIVEYRKGGADGPVLHLSAFDFTDPAFDRSCSNAALCVEDQALNQTNALGMTIPNVEAGRDGDLVWLVLTAQVSSDVIPPKPTPRPKSVFNYVIVFGWSDSPWMFRMFSTVREDGDALITAFIALVESTKTGTPTPN